MKELIDIVNGIIWSNALIIFLLLIGLYFSFRMRFVQIRLLKRMLRLLFVVRSSKEGVSSFQAFALALSGRIGTGNIAGVATAIAWGGPGSVFWMWIIAFIGGATAFAETTLAQIYKEVKDGEYRGGPAFYMAKGLRRRWYAIIFAITIMVVNSLITSGIQSNSMVLGLDHAFDIDPLYSGIIIAVLLSLIIFGGVHRIGKAAGIIVPFMALGYMLLVIIILTMNLSLVPDMFKLIFESAFGLDATFGGIAGSAISWGVKRGMFSNEAGQGTAPHAAAAAEVEHPVEQGLVQTFSVYVDTLFVCTATALVILISGLYNVEDSTGAFIVENIPGSEPGTEFTQIAVSHFFPSFGTEFVAISLSLFAFTTLMALYYMAETNLSFLFRDKINSYALWGLRVCMLLGIIYGSFHGSEFAWTFGDIGVGLITWLNLVALFLLRKPVLKSLKDYEKQIRDGITVPIFIPKKLGIKNAKFWDKKATNKKS